VINEILNRFQGIDIIVHNVGVTSAPCGGFINVTDEIWQWCASARSAEDRRPRPARTEAHGFCGKRMARLLTSKMAP